MLEGKMTVKQPGVTEKWTPLPRRPCSEDHSAQAPCRAMDGDTQTTDATSRLGFMVGSIISDGEKGLEQHRSV